MDSASEPGNEHGSPESQATKAANIQVRQNTAALRDSSLDSPTRHEPGHGGGNYNPRGLPMDPSMPHGPFANASAE